MAALVRRFPDVDVAAIRQRRLGRDRQLRVWYVLRACETFPGYVMWEDVERARLQLGLSTRTMRAVLGAGDGFFWSCHAHGVYIRATSTVAAVLGVPRLRRSYWAPVDHLCGSLTTWRAKMAMEGVAQLRTVKMKGRLVYVPVSNRTMAQMLGVSVETVHQWKRISGFRVQPNFALVCPLRPHERVRDFIPFGGPSLRSRWWGNKRWLVRQLSSRLFPMTERGGRTSLRRINSRIAGQASLTRNPAKGPACSSQCTRYLFRPRRTAASLSSSEYQYVGLAAYPAFSPAALWDPAPVWR